MSGTRRKKQPRDTYISVKYRMSEDEKRQYDIRLKQRYHFNSILVTIKAMKLDFPADRYINLYMKNDKLVPLKEMGRLVDVANRNNIPFNIRELNKIVNHNLNLKKVKR